MAIKLSTGLRNILLGRSAALNGDGLAGALHLGLINVYSGAQPANADAAATGTLLGVVSVNASGTGLTFDTPTAGTLSKLPSEVWQMTGTVAGTAGWFRFFAAGGNPAISSTVEVRLDGSIATTGGDLNMSNVHVTVGSPHTIDVFQFVLPEF